jgi:hypothetical protein
VHAHSPQSDDGHDWAEQTNHLIGELLTQVSLRSTDARTGGIRHLSRTHVGVWQVTNGRENLQFIADTHTLHVTSAFSRAKDQEGHAFVRMIEHVMFNDNRIAEMCTL